MQIEVRLRSTNLPPPISVICYWHEAKSEAQPHEVQTSDDDGVTTMYDNQEATNRMTMRELHPPIVVNMVIANREDKCVHDQYC